MNEFLNENTEEKISKEDAISKIKRLIFILSQYKNKNNYDLNFFNSKRIETFSNSDKIKDYLKSKNNHTLIIISLLFSRSSIDYIPFRSHCCYSGRINNRRIKKIKIVKVKSLKRHISDDKKEKSANIIMQFWKLNKLKFISMLRCIIFIQSCWRGYLIRQYIFNLLYLDYLYINLCLKLSFVLEKKIIKDVFKKIVHLNKTNNDN